MDWKRLADHVKQRRTDLGIKQDDVVRFAGSGLSLPVLSQIENARNDSPRESTLAALDRGLRWMAGSSRQVLGGGEPTDLLVAVESAEKRRQRFFDAADDAFRKLEAVDSDDPQAEELRAAVAAAEEGAIRAGNSVRTLREQLDEWEERSGRGPYAGTVAGPVPARVGVASARIDATAGPPDLSELPALYVKLRKDVDELKGLLDRLTEIRLDEAEQDAVEQTDRAPSATPAAHEEGGGAPTSG